MTPSKTQKPPKQAKIPSTPTSTTPPPSKFNAATTLTFHPYPLLPPELRVRILTHAVLPSPTPLRIHHHSDAGLQPRSTKRTGLRNLHNRDYAILNKGRLAVCLASSEAYLEGSALYYSRNAFHFDDGEAQVPFGRVPSCSLQLQRFASAIGATNAAFITHLALTYHSCHSYFKLIGLPFPLKRLDIEILSHDHCMPGDLEKYVEGKQGLKVRLESNRADCCSYWEEVKKRFLANVEGKGGGRWEAG